MSFTTVNLLGQVLFGAIGMGAFIYGKKQGIFMAMLLGVILMAYPYFVPDTALLYLIGGILTACLFIFRG